MSFISNRLKRLNQDVFSELENIKDEKLKKGVDIIDFGMGDPDMPPPQYVIEELCRTAKDPLNHRYPRTRGLSEFREEASRFYKRRFNIDLDPETEILPLIGIKEGLAHICTALVDVGDIVLVPDPCYPFYFAVTLLSGGEIYRMPLLEENGFVPDLSSIDEQIAKKAKLMFLNYPNNPTAGTVEKAFFEDVVKFAKKYNIAVCHECIYADICFDGYEAPSFLQIQGAKDIGVEYYSLSKTYNMAGWRIGFAAGNREIIWRLKTVKLNIDSGIFQPIQYAAIAALKNDIPPMREIYQKRRDILVDGLNRLGWKVSKPKATFYVWTRIPDRYSDTNFPKMLLQELDIIVAPGIGFGEYGKDYVRFSLTLKEDRIKEAIRRLEKFL